MADEQKAERAENNKHQEHSAPVPSVPPTGGTPLSKEIIKSGEVPSKTPSKIEGSPSTGSGPSAREPIQDGECAPSACEGCPLGGSRGPAAGQEEESKTPDPPTPGASDGQGELADEYLAGWQRAKADYANLLKEIDVIRAELAKYACAGLITELLPVLDSLNKALEHKPELPKGEAEKWAEGIGHTRSQFMSALEQAGVTAIDETGVAFDPEVHDAMMREAKDGIEPGTVIRIAEPGFRLHDRVIKPAKVIVAE